MASLKNELKVAYLHLKFGAWQQRFILAKSKYCKKSYSEKDIFDLRKASRENTCLFKESLEKGPKGIMKKNKSKLSNKTIPNIFFNFVITVWWRTLRHASAEEPGVSVPNDPRLLDTDERKRLN